MQTRGPRKGDPRMRDRHNRKMQDTGETRSLIAKLDGTVMIR